MPLTKTFHIFNSDRTYSMDRVVDLLDSVKAELPFSFTVKRHSFSLSRMRDLSEEVSSFDMDYAVFVVHANESRLSINDGNIESSYTVLFQALLRATGLTEQFCFFVGTQTRLCRILKLRLR